MKKITGSYNAQYFYSSNGNRLKAVRNGVTTKYVYDMNGNLLAEADSNNVITKYYIHGSGLMAMITPSGQVYNYHFNAIGSTIAITDHNQNIVNKYSYDEFGNILNKVEAASQPFKYVGQYGVMHEANGFYYMRARYYDPKVGRWISEDPIGFEGGDVNLMRYVGNNVINWIDPWGLMAPKPPPPSLGDFIPPSKIPCGSTPDEYCGLEYEKMKKLCGISPNPGCLEKARRWYAQCLTWANAVQLREIPCPPQDCKDKGAW